MLARTVDLLTRESAVAVLLGVFAALVVLGLGAFVTPDTWLVLVSGRQVAAGGPPARDTLTAWTLGRDWIDQQWLGQLVLYETWRLGGLVAVGLLHAAIVVAVFGAVLAGALRRGGSVGHVALVGLAAAAPVLLVAGNIRTQTFALALFAAVLWLLCENGRRPGTRVFWTLPLLVLWANVHGSVLVGVGFVGLAGVLALLRHRRDRRRAARALTLAALAPVTLLATPYGASILTYFRDLLGNGEIPQIASDWTPPRLELVQLPFFALGALAFALLGRDRRALTSFEQLALVLTFLAALSAARNLAWFGLTAALLLPAALTAARGDRARRLWPRRYARPLVLAAAIGLLVAMAVSLPRMDAQVDREFPPDAGRVIATAARDPALRLFVHPRYADWLLWRHPELTGRLPLDIRYELLSETELRRFRIFRDQIGVDWRAAAGRARLVVMDSSEEPLDALPPTSSVLAREPGARRLFDRHDVAVVLRPR